jgi:LysR family nitrogen assimilation transcriptional regulator
MQDELLNARLDVALLYGGQTKPGLESEHLMSEELVYVSARPAGLAEDPQELYIKLSSVAALPLVIPSRPNALRMHVEQAMLNAGFRPHITFEVDGVPAILDLVADGAGNAVLTEHAVQSSFRPSAFVTKSFEDQPLSIPVSIATSAKRPSTQIQRKTIELLKRIVLESISKNSAYS